MLLQLHIKNFIRFKDVHINFTPGMTVVTGASGAGKSLIMHALKLLSGAPCEKHYLGEDPILIQGVFDAMQHPVLNELLEAQGLPMEDTFIIRREIKNSGQSRLWINEQQTGLSVLKKIAPHIICMLEQHAQVMLKQTQIQRQWLDTHVPIEMRTQTAHHYHHWQSLKKELAEHTERQTRDDVETLDYFIEELETFSPSLQDLETLESDLKALSDAENIIHQIKKLNDLNTFIPMIYNVQNTLIKHHETHTLINLLEDAHHLIQETLNAGQDYTHELSDKMQEKTTIEQRISQYHHLARKHHITPDQLEAHLEKIKEQKQSLINSKQNYHDLNLRTEEAQAQFEQTARALSASRQEHAKNLACRINEMLPLLSMDPIFKIHVEQAHSSEHGHDQITFIYDRDGKFLNITKSASGGELTRMCLLLQLLQPKSAPVLVLDEADTGISGIAAGQVAKLLKSHAQTHQIICISHLPQIAAYADTHLQVMKEKNTSTIMSLSKEARIEALAGLLNAEKKHKSAKEHAQALLDEAQN